jgi:phosphate transport system substrate-binding protein
MRRKQNYMRLRSISKAFGRSRWLFSLALVSVTGASLLLAACGGDEGNANDENGDSEPSLSGEIVGDGSSTVFPIAEAVAEEFRRLQPDVNVVVGVSGTGGGFTKFCNDETDFSNASRPIRDAEVQACATKNIGAVELQVAFDGLSVIVNPQNNFVDCLTVEELKRIWEPNSTINNWSQVREGFPNQPLTLYGPGADSGTFEYFTEVINGTARASRSDYTASEDDNVLVQGIAGDRNALGYFGFAYYEENQNRLKLVAVDSGNGCVEPSSETILDNTYKPLSRPIFTYVKESELARPEVQALFEFWMTEGGELAAEVGYVEAPDSVYSEGLAKVR